MQILNNPNRWNYYGSDYGNDWSHLFDSENCAKNFIRSYFNQGGKDYVFLKDISKMTDRWRHTVSVFLMGLLIGPKLLNVNFEKYKYGGHINIYLWYLTCLYHDFGYIVENNNMVKKYNPIIDTVTIKGISLYKTLNQIYEHLPEGEFSQLSVLDYYLYRLEKFMLRDHGIAGGVLLYHQLDEILKEKLGNKSEICDEHLKWDINQEEDFARCANAIITHNIWLDEKIDIEELKLKNGEKHIYKDWLTALLILSDTIEPIKRYPCCQPNEVLSNISFDVDSERNQLIIDLSDWNCCIQSVFEKQCKGLEQWTYIKVQCDRKHRITLSGLNSIYKEKRIR